MGGVERGWLQCLPVELRGLGRPHILKQPLLARGGPPRGSSVPGTSPFLSFPCEDPSSGSCMRLGLSSWPLPGTWAGIFPLFTSGLSLNFEHLSTSRPRPAIPPHTGCTGSRHHRGGTNSLMGCSCWRDGQGTSGLSWGSVVQWAQLWTCLEWSVLQAWQQA